MTSKILIVLASLFTLGLLSTSTALPAWAQNPGPARALALDAAVEVEVSEADTANGAPHTPIMGALVEVTDVLGTPIAPPAVTNIMGIARVSIPRGVNTVRVCVSKPGYRAEDGSAKSCKVHFLVDGVLYVRVLLIPEAPSSPLASQRRDSAIHGRDQSSVGTYGPADGMLGGM
jgi:hypothetical protein